MFFFYWFFVCFWFLTNGKADDEGQDDDQCHTEADDNKDLFLRLVAMVGQFEKEKMRIEKKTKKKTIRKS